MSTEAQDTLDAIRLALEAGANFDAQLRVIRALVASGPPPDGSSTRSVERFLAAVRSSGSELRVAS
jgi:hypothetical protein